MIGGALLLDAEAATWVETGTAFLTLCTRPIKSAKTTTFSENFNKIPISFGYNYPTISFDNSIDDSIEYLSLFQFFSFVFQNTEQYKKTNTKIRAKSFAKKNSFLGNL